MLAEVFLQNWYWIHHTQSSVDVLLLTVLLVHAVYAGSATIAGVVGACLSILITGDVLIASTLLAVSVLRYLTYCDGHVCHISHVTVAVVPAILGVHHVGVVVIQ